MVQSLLAFPASPSSSAVRVLVCGGRRFGDAWLLSAVLSAVVASAAPAPVVVASGLAPGADSLARGFALSRGLAFRGFPAEWSRFGRSAGPRRNVAMVRAFSPSLVVAFPGGRGSAHLVSVARSSGVPVLFVAPR